MIKYVDKPSEITELIAEHRKANSVIKTFKLNFLGVDGYDVYNISNAFDWKGVTYIAGRVEKRDSEISVIRFFVKVTEDTYKATEYFLPMMQDPYMTVIDGEIIIGGTEIFLDRNGKINNWHTTFFKGKDLADLQQFAVAPDGMKDVRIVKNDKFYVFTRPQGGIAKAGKIGLITADSINEINNEFIRKAVLLNQQFNDDCWGGVNQIIILKNNLLGIVGHIATMSKGDIRHYYGMVFAYNTEKKKCTKVKIIAERADFMSGDYKREDLIDVVFLGGLTRNSNGTATIYTGLSDAEAHIGIIKDPFLEYEKGEK